MRVIRAFQMKSQPKIIHYILQTSDGEEHRMVTPRGSKLGNLIRNEFKLTEIVERFESTEMEPF